MVCACVCSVALELTNGAAGSRYEAAASVGTDNIADIGYVCVVQLSMRPLLLLLFTEENCRYTSDTALCYLSVEEPSNCS